MEPAWGWERLVHRNVRQSRECTRGLEIFSLYNTIWALVGSADEPVQYLSGVCFMFPVCIGTWILEVMVLTCLCVFYR